METKDYENEAILDTRDYLVQLLKEKNWCKARTVGKALELLLETRNAPAYPSAGTLSEESPKEERINKMPAERIRY
jgi:hypothetical protein